ncbi:CLIP-associating protein 1 [Acipenser ruthenus]|uniref:CLIP-associating protein 1 n=1 Tax=Acipenser ruthenus TaxID=7906 RepID=A0A444UFP8_ACIRT|nr:CLIP-associating protein 1 [Acipenser ruthenus]
MDPTDFVNSSETRLAVSRIITWTTEPKSSDVRKVHNTGIFGISTLNNGMWFYSVDLYNDL